MQHPLIKTITAYTNEAGVDFFGVADICAQREAFARVWPASLADISTGIVVGLHLDDAVVDQLLGPAETVPAEEYWSRCYRDINDRLDLIVFGLAELLVAQGYRGVVIPATLKVDADGLLGPFTHKAIARLAGLGWIGKSCMLITPQVGPRVRWATVLTDAPLPGSGAPLKGRCGSCRACVDICPVSAYTGRPFAVDEPVALRFDTHRCQAHLKSAPVCGKCLAVCPWGRITG
ncbi:MAG: 4Fe-4S dicluster domain-containing protein [bacterium]